jgi:hypothetical protein
MTVWAIIKFQKEGLHYWKEAPEVMKYLGYTHRHKFYFIVQVEQTHNERDLEYFTLKDFVEKQVPEINGPESCETLASNLRIQILKYFQYKRQVKVQVMEDNENGALVE